MVCLLSWWTLMVVLVELWSIRLHRGVVRWPTLMEVVVDLGTILEVVWW